MNTLRTTRTFALVSLMTLVAFGLASPASAHDKGKHSGGSISINFGGGSSKYFGGSNFCKSPNYCFPNYCSTNYCNYPSYCNYSSYCSYPSYGCYDSFYSCSTPVLYPVLVYDSFSHATVVWKTTGYGSTSMAILR
jgi:hypothetical protein